MPNFFAARAVLGSAAVLLVALLWTVAPSSAHAQPSDSTLAARFQLAESYLRAGQFDRAIYLLEDLYAARPSTYLFFDKLKEAYEGVKRYDEAIALVEERIEEGQNPVVFLAEKARLLYLKGDEQAAFDTWDAALQAEPDNRNTYRVVYQSLNGVRLLHRAIEVLEQGRERLGAAAGFQADLAALYSLTGQHEQAMEAYLSLLEQNEQQLNFVRSRLSRHLEQEEARRAGIAATERARRTAPLNRAYRELLAWLYLEDGQYRKALDENRAIDRLEKEDGRVLFAFAQSASDAGAFDVATEAYEEILTRYPTAPAAADARLGLGMMHEQWARKSGERPVDEQGKRLPAPHFEQALAAYQAFAEQHPRHAYYPEVLRRIGQLQQDVFFDLGAAEGTLQEVAGRYPRTQAADLAEYELGRIALMRGQLDRARVAFSNLTERLRTGELAEKARYELALLHFYQGEFDAAQTLAEVLNENTSTDVANDAIELKVLLIGNKGPDSLHTPLRLYARAHLLDRQRRTDTALQVLDSLLTQYGSHALADDARYLRAVSLRKTGRAREAFAAFSELPLLHPTSYLADRSLFRAAEVLEQELGDEEQAIQTYTRLLTEYPGSLLTSDARDRIRALRGDAL